MYFVDLVFAEILPELPILPMLERFLICLDFRIFVRELNLITPVEDFIECSIALIAFVVFEVKKVS